MKEYQETVGIDVSKETLDAHLHQKGTFTKVKNDKDGFISLIKWVTKTSGFGKDSVFWCFEHTGIYSLQLAAFLTEKKIPFAIVPPLQVKKSLGMIRGKNDKIDARRLSEYAYLRRHKLQQTVLPSKTILKMKDLLTLRERMVSHRAGYITSSKEMKTVLGVSESAVLISTQQQLIKALTKSINQVENQIIDLIKEDENILKTYKLLVSIVGIGFVVAASLIVVTNCFTGFQNSRQLACYSGIAPFEKQSGTSLQVKSKVSPYANKRLKALLDRSASTAIQNDPELRLYYERRLQAGKSPRSTINIVRNKILHRVFAVVKRETPYVKIYRHAA